MATIFQLIRELNIRVVDRAAVVFRGLGAGSGRISRRWVALTEISGEADMTQKIRVSLLAKHESVRDELRKVFSGDDFLLWSAVSSEAPRVAQMGALDVDPRIDVIVIDGSDRSFGFDASHRLAARGNNARLALLLDHYIFEDVVEAFQTGVDAVIIKGLLRAPLIESIKLVALGEKVFPSQLVDDLTRAGPVDNRSKRKCSPASIGLSGRELEILESLMAGMANKVIARQFGICEGTVKVHVKAILRKLGVENRTQAATWGVMNGLAKPGELGLRDAGPARAAHGRRVLAGQAA